MNVLPKPRSTVQGPIPAEFVGTEKKGAKGPRQIKCEGQGGHWIGPVGKRWCQIPFSTRFPVHPASPPIPAPYPLAYQRPMEPVTVPPSNNDIVPHQELAPGSRLDSGAVGTVVNTNGGRPGATGGPVSNSANVSAPSGTGALDWRMLGLFAALGAGALFYFGGKKKRSAKPGRRRSSKRRRRR